MIISYIADNSASLCLRVRTIGAVNGEPYNSKRIEPEDIAGVRRFADLPRNARRYAGAMMKALLAVAYDGRAWPAALPNLRYLGVGPLPTQIIKDVPATAELIQLAGS